MNDLYLGYKNLTRKRMRFALTLIAIVIAFLIYGVLASFQRSFNSDGGAEQLNAGFDAISIGVEESEEVEALYVGRVLVQQTEVNGFSVAQ